MSVRAALLAAATAGGGITAAVVLAASGGTAGAATARAAATLPPPKFGKSVDIGLVSGKVLVTPPGEQTFKLGVQDRNVPIGSLIDTTHGRVDLRSAPTPAYGAARAAAAKVEDAQFYAGKFRVGQNRNSAYTQIRLAGGNFASCTAKAGRASAAGAGRGVVARRLPHRIIRLLHASGPGRFRTIGKRAAATVLGTIWLTVDYCDGTYVKSTQGRVTVHNYVNGKTVNVYPGHPYFARYP
jgi:hypothetical protein